MAVDKKTTMDINEAHGKGGHVHKSVLKRTFESFGKTLQGTLKPCDGCMKAKARGNAIPKCTSNKGRRTNVPGYHRTIQPIPWWNEIQCKIGRSIFEKNMGSLCEKEK